MPLLPFEYFGNWYTVYLDQKPRILQSYNENFVQPTSTDKKMIQGDIGNHIVDISPGHYTLALTSPILIIDPPGAFYDVFDLVLDNLRLFVQNPYDYTQIANSNYVLDSANINLSTEESSVSCNLESWQAFNKVGVNYNSFNPEIDFIARKAKYYDIQIGIFGKTFLISGLNLQIKVNYTKSFYVPGSNLFKGNQTPLYSIQSYTVSGDVSLVITPGQYDQLKIYNSQIPGTFTAAKNNVFLKILTRNQANSYDRTINLGDFMFLPSVDFQLSANGPITAKVSFATLFRRSSSITIQS
jgi:hypothetical protein